MREQLQNLQELHSQPSPAAAPAQTEQSESPPAVTASVYHTTSLQTLFVCVIMYQFSVEFCCVRTLYFP